MKQHITIEQLNELSEKGKVRLREWWFPTNVREHDLYWFGEDYEVETIGCCEDEVSVGKELPLLLIGQLIEFLDETEKNNFHGITKDGQGIYYVSWNSDDPAFTKNIRYHGEKSIHPVTNMVYRDGKELVDTLWWVVKTILEK